MLVYFFGCTYSRDNRFCHLFHRFQSQQVLFAASVIYLMANNNTRPKHLINSKCLKFTFTIFNGCDLIHTALKRSMNY